MPRVRWSYALLALFLYFFLVHTNNMGELLSLLDQSCGLVLSLLFLMPFPLYFY